MSLPSPTSTDAAGRLGRHLWTLFEPYHAVVYFDPDVKAMCIDAGFSGFWQGYFATRAAPLGPVGAQVVAATFFGFAPAMVQRAVPSAWSVCPPTDAWSLRLAIADRALRRHLDVDDPTLRDAADLALDVVERLVVAGRPLAAATAAQPVPDEAHLALWHSCTVLREHRGDGHVATLVANGVDPLKAHALTAAADITPAELLVAHRGWTSTQWDRAVAAAATRPPGFRGQLEAATDAAAAAPWRSSEAAAGGQLASLLAPLVTSLVNGGGVPYPNLMDVPQPALPPASWQP